MIRAAIITLQSNDAAPTVVAVADTDVCEQPIVGQKIQFSYAATGITVMPPPAVGTVSRLEAGDRACYVNLIDANGESTLQVARFEVCQQNILNTEVKLTYQPDSIYAASCQGDLDFDTPTAKASGILPSRLREGTGLTVLPQPASWS